MAGEENLFELAEEAIVRRFSAVDLHDEPYPFDPLTSYYHPEFGEGLTKRMFSVSDLVPPDQLVDIKIWTNDLEEELGQGAEGELKRRVNIDPGYLNHSKVVLATTKDHAHRLYIGRGIFEEITLNYHRREQGYLPNPWTYPDYRMPERLAFFARVRDQYCEQIEEEA